MDDGRDDSGDGAVEDVLAEVGHELANPLTVAKGFAQQLLDPDLSREDRLQAARSIDRNIRIALQLLANYRDAARSGDDPLTLDLAWVQLTDVVDATVGDAAATAGSHAIDVEHADPDVQLLVDRARLRQALFNLLTNAVKHTPAGTAIHVRTRADAGTVTIDVADEGDGVAPALVDRIFEPRVHAPKSGGLGLGLYVARRIAHAHNGTLELVRGSDLGATFRLTLPTAEPDDPHART